MHILCESLNKYFDNLEERYLIESKPPVHALEMYVMLLEFLSGKSFKYLLSTTPKIGKDGVVRNYHDYCVHHLDNIHSNNNFGNVVVMRVSDHNALHSGKKQLHDCDYINVKDYLQKYINEIERSAENRNNNI